MSPSPAAQAYRRLVAAADSGDVARLCRDLGIRLLVVFGSASRAATRDGASDVDVAFSRVAGQQLDAAEVAIALTGLAGSEHVDVLDLDAAGIVARDQALGGGRPLHEAEPGTYAREQMLAASRRLDTAWFRRQDLERMARR